MVAHENRDLYQEKDHPPGRNDCCPDTTVTKLTPQPEEQLAGMENRKEESSLEKPAPGQGKGIRKTTGSYEELYNHRTGIYQRYVLVHYTYLEIWDVIMFMFLAWRCSNSAFSPVKKQSGDLLDHDPRGAGVGACWFLTGTCAPIEVNGYNDFNYHRNVPFEAYTLSRTLRGLGIYNLLMLMYKSGWFKWLFAIFRPVGQMALQLPDSVPHLRFYFFLQDWFGLVWSAPAL